MGTVAGRLSETEEAAICALAERGLKAGQIARRLNRKRGTINFAMHRLGVTQPAVRQFDYMRGGRRVRSFTPDEDAFIEVLRTQGFSPTRIADLHHKRFGYQRVSHSIRVRLLMLANRESTS